jgi:hypothetical protein
LQSLFSAAQKPFDSRAGQIVVARFGEEVVREEVVGEEVDGGEAVDEGVPQVFLTPGSYILG